jgi:hypothetical protein
MENGSCNASVDTLGRQLGITRSTVERALQKLVTLGLLEKHQTPHNIPNIYKVNGKVMVRFRVWADVLHHARIDLIWPKKQLYTGTLGGSRMVSLGLEDNVADKKWKQAYARVLVEEKGDYVYLRGLGSAIPNLLHNAIQTVLGYDVTRVTITWATYDDRAGYSF